MNDHTLHDPHDHVLHDRDRAHNLRHDHVHDLHLHQSFLHVSYHLDYHLQGYLHLHLLWNRCSSHLWLFCLFWSNCWTSILFIKKKPKIKTGKKTAKDRIFLRYYFQLLPHRSVEYRFQIYWCLQYHLLSCFWDYHHQDSSFLWTGLFLICYQCNSSKFHLLSNHLAIRKRKFRLVSWQN